MAVFSSVEDKPDSKFAKGHSTYKNNNNNKKHIWYLYLGDSYLNTIVTEFEATASASNI